MARVIGTKYGATWSEDVPLEPQPTINHSLSFDGVDDYVEIPKSGSLNLDGSSDCTITYLQWPYQVVRPGVSLLVIQELLLVVA